MGSVCRHLRGILECTVSFSPDGMKVVGVCDRTKAGGRVSVCRRHGAFYQNSVSFSPDGTIVVSSADRTAKVIYRVEVWLTV